ncbi:MAG TPA: deoxyribose-phosphate aldolase [Xanthomonadales bacterium]|nr:deoxyribose-phosphate aldolase [Xanthomonadales bacterium]
MTAVERRALAARLLPLLDLTSLGEDDTPARIEALCRSARTPHGTPAAVCVYPEHATTVRRAVDGSGIRVAAVVNFPDGSADGKRIARETRRAIAAGADEIDAVFPYHELRVRAPKRARRAVDACVDACGGVPLKLILETGELGSDALVRQACRIGLDAGVAFLKTSTGKVAVGATPDAARWMLDEIARDGARCGFKASGGIRRLEDAATYVALAEARLGSAWLDAAHFRIGASALYTEILAALGDAS